MRYIPVDVSALTFVCVSAPRPKLVSRETGEVKVDRDGNTVFTVGLSAAGESGRVELLNVAVSGDPGVTVGQVVRPVGLVAFPWERQAGGRLRWGIAYRAAQIVPVAPAVVPVPGEAGDAPAAVA
ncbi:hypothetical protein Acsp04_53150 [Actinomadura sp. NBRC 104425]|uniref:SCO3933 family regulatory protein n=1 Tax=Actinomadura sp. NBRC 104425 TaxID=3032204 RepID=UPI0024A3D94E|nr:hypothetical protein [Actinomadura sp. NBRC 104425]GLZ15080.1 hypothetical protein Acsp04_53150 [Actinomadura sp. NBRC 104425]